MQFGHEKLIVYQIALEYVRFVFGKCDDLSGKYRHAKDQWLRASQSIVLNIAEGNGKSGVADKRKYLEIARGSALECSAIQDVLVVGCSLSAAEREEGKNTLIRIVSMLTKLGQRADVVRENSAEYSKRGVSVEGGESENESDYDNDYEEDVKFYYQNDGSE
jgi:four helix bundle protein